MTIDIARIDEFIGLLDAASNDDELRRLFRRHSVDYDPDLPSDPFGEAYRDHQLALYEKVQGSSYDTSHEAYAFNVADAAITPFPYVTQSAETVGNQLMMIGFLIRALELPAGSRVLEFGFGWGNTTMALAKMGYQVTAIDIGSRFVDLIKKRAAMENITRIDARVGDFFAIEQLGEEQQRYDAVLFFECFHHCADHLRLLNALNRVVKPGGKVCFAGEPIVDDFPIPWGLRMDGESLWAIRKHGWLELGFNRRYFDEALARAGWGATNSFLPSCPGAHALIAKRLSEPLLEWRFRSGTLQHQVGSPLDLPVEGGRSAGIRTDGRTGYLMYGPYKHLEAGHWRVRLIRAPLDVDQGGHALLDVVAQDGKMMMSRMGIDFSSLTENFVIELNFELNFPVDDVQVRLFCDTGCNVGILGVDLYRITS